MGSSKKYVLVGGGIGSFCFYNCLRVHGVPSNDISVISPNSRPYEQLKLYCDNLGLKSEDRLRSDSGSRPDNFWGFPGYGLSEAVEAIHNKQLIKSISLLIKLICEPIVFGYYTPTAGRVYKSIDKEAKRIGWKDSLIIGKALSLTKLPDNKYAVTYKNQGKRKKMIADYIHLSLGHGGLGKDSPYKDNKSLFTKIRRSGGSVLVVGRGTAAAKTVEQLLSINGKKPIQVVSLHRGELASHKDYRNRKQRKLMSWRLQQFNWPRSAFGGELLEIINGSGVNEYEDFWGSPSAIPEKNFIQTIKDGVKNRRYEIVYKKVKTNYVINCTGFRESTERNDLYTRLIKKYNLPVNKNGGIKTGEHFEIEELCSYKGRVFVSGVAAAGNNYGPVDSFLGLQYAALKATESISEIKPLSLEESFSGWLKWLKGEKI